MDNRVFMAACENYDIDLVRAQVARVLEWQGGARTLMAAGNRVLIKPNLLMAREPDGATTAHPAVVQAVAEAFVAEGAQVTIADSSGGAYNARAMARTFELCGMAQAARASGARLNEDFSSRSVKYGRRSFEIITPALEADVIINVAKLKTHMLTYYTGAVKNMFGTVAGTHKAAMHARHPYAEGFCRMLVDLCLSRVPTLSIIDGVQGMDGKGPSGGRVRQSGVLIASPNPWAADLAAMHHAGLSPSRAPVHRTAARRGLVPAKAADLAMAGDAIPPLAEPFVPADGEAALLTWMNDAAGGLLGLGRIRRWRMAYPEFSRRCVGCGDCAAVCPQSAIEIVAGRAALQRKKCIKCYCCHELCPIKAVDLP